MGLEKESKKSKGRKKKKQVGTSRKKKSSSNYSGKSSRIKKQVEKLELRAVTQLEKMAKDDKTSLKDFLKTTRAMKQSFAIMKAAIGLCDVMEKIADENQSNKANSASLGS